MTDFASIGIKFDSTDVDKGAKSLDDLAVKGAKAEDATKKLASASEVLASAARAAAGAFAAWKVLDHIKEVALLNARYETLGVSMRVVGGHAGYTASQMDAAEMSLRKTGISMIEARQQALRLVQAHIDLADSTKLARIAQDAAVIGGINSSEAFDRMIHGITTGQTEILRGIGINVSMDQSYKTMAASLHKHADQLSQNEKMQAVVNAVMEKGKDIAGVYEAAMDTAGKQVTSMTRYTEDLKVKQGEVFNEALTVAVMAWTAHLKDANGEIDKLAQNNELEAWGASLTNMLAGLADNADNLAGAIKIVALSVAAAAAMTANAFNPDAIKAIKEGYNTDVDAILAKQDRFTKAVDDRRVALAETKNKAAEAERAHQESMTNIMLYYTDLRIKGLLSEQQYLETVVALNNQAVDGHHYTDTPAPAKVHEGLSEYQKLTKAIQEKIAAQQIEIAVGENATAGQKDYQKFLADLTGGYLKLKPVEIGRLATLHDQNMANERAIALTAQRIALEKSFEKEASEIYTAWSDAHKDMLVETQKEIDAQIEHNATVGLSKEALVALADSKRNDAIASKERELAAVRGTAADAEQLDLIGAEIKALQELRSLKTVGAQKDIAADAAKHAADEWEKTAETIERSLTDSLMRGFESGKGFGENFRDTLVNMFKTLVLRPVIQATVQGGLSALGVGDPAAASAGSGGFGSLLSAGNSAYSLFNGGGSSLYSSFATSGVGSTLGLSALVANPTTTYSMSLAPNLLTGTAGQSVAGGVVGGESVVGMTALGEGIGAAIPYVGIAIAVASLLGAFGDSGPVDRSSKYQKSFGAANDLGINPDGGSAYTFKNNFRFDAGMSASQESFSASLTTSEQSAIAALHLTTAQIAAINEELKKSADAVYSFGIEHTDWMASSADEMIVAARMQAMATALGKTVAEIAAALDPLFGALVKVGGYIGLTSDQMLKFADTSANMQTLTANIGAYFDGFFSDSEKLAKGHVDLAAAFAALNQTVPSTYAGFRQIVEALDLTTVAGQSAFTGLMALAPAFKQVADAADAAAKASRDAADAAASKLTTALTAIVDSVGKMHQGVADADKGVADARANILSAYNAAQGKVVSAQESLNALMQQSATATQAFGKSLRDYVVGLSTGVHSASNPAAQYRTLGAQLQSTAVLAGAGDQASRDKLTGIADAYLTAARANARTATDYARDQARVGNLLDNLARDLPDVSANAAPTLDQQIADAQSTLASAQADLVHYTQLAADTGTDTAAGVWSMDSEIKGLRGAYDKATADQLLATEKLSVALEALKTLGTSEDTLKATLSGSTGDFATALGVSDDTIKTLQSAIGISDAQLKSLSDAMNVKVADGVYDALGNALGVPSALFSSLGVVLGAPDELMQGLAKGLGISPVQMLALQGSLGMSADQALVLESILGSSPETQKTWATALGFDAKQIASLATILGFDPEKTAPLASAIGLAKEVTTVLPILAGSVGFSIPALDTRKELETVTGFSGDAQHTIDGLATSVGFDSLTYNVIQQLGKSLGLSDAADAALSGLVTALKEAPQTVFGQTVTNAYTGILGRAPDEKGYADWISGLYSGRETQAAFIGDFLHAAIGTGGQDAANALAYAHANNLPGFADGTSFVPNDMVAQIHRGEEITPRPYVDLQRASRDETNALLSRLVGSNEAMARELIEVRAELSAIKGASKETAGTLNVVTRFGRAMQTEVFA